MKKLLAGSIVLCLVYVSGLPFSHAKGSGADFTPFSKNSASENTPVSEEWLTNTANQPIIAGIFEQDYNALVALYNATDGANWTNKTGWLEEGVDARYWYGISVSQSRVTNISLTNNNLSGTIPVEIGILTNLTQLLLSGNQLTGHLPEEMGALTSLQTLWLGINQLSGTIPAEIGSLTSLTQLIVSHNGFTGSLPKEIGALANLQILVLTDNQFTGTIPSEIGNLTSLTQLLLDYNDLTGSLPSELGNLQSLTSLHLDNNPLSGPIPLSLTNLDDFAVGSNYFRFVGTSLCEPQDQAWLDWKTGRNITGNGISCTPADLYTFRFEETYAYINIASSTVSLNLPGADISSLAVEFEVAAGATVSLAGVPQVSGTTSNDFRQQPLVYTIISEDGQQSLDWTVTVTNQPIVAGIFEQDYDALVALYNATNGANWTNNTGWLEEGVDAKDWYGVFVIGNRVSGLDLINNNLSGAIPGEIGNLSALLSLGLRGNQLSGTIPEEIGSLNSLKFLYLQSNQLSGPIPTEIGNLGSLSQLNLSFNQLSGSIPTEIGNLGMLQLLSLSFNQLVGTLPAEMSNMSSLLSLFLHYNQLSGSLPEEFLAFSNLQSLWLNNNQLSGAIPPEIGNLSSLTQLLLSNNNFTGSIPKEIGTLSNLLSLILQNNELSGTIPSEIGNLQSLISLELSDNPFTGPIPLSLTDLDNLAAGSNYFRYTGTNLCEPQDQQWLDWKTGRNITGNDITCTPTYLQSFSIDGMDANIDPTNIIISLELPVVDRSSLVAEFVVAAGASVSIEGVPQVSGVTSNDFSQPLTYTITSEDEQQSVDWLVDITSQPVVAGIIEQDYDALVALYNATDGANWTNNTGWLEEGVDAEDWFGITVGDGRVTDISLYGNNLSGVIPEEIGNLTGLQSLDINSNQLVGAIPTEITNLSGLNTLLLNDNDLSGTIPMEIGNLTALQYLSLANNQLTGTIPVEIGNLNDLLHLAISGNQLSGAIPVEIGNLTVMQLLSLGGNQLSGVVPKEMGNLSALQYLWLSYNQLSGNLPEEIWNLTGLTQLDVSHNTFTGGLHTELGNLQNLKYLNLNNNPFVGPVPLALINLDYLGTEGYSFSYAGTNLCEPQNQEWLDWKVGRNITGNDIVCTPTDLYVFRLEEIDANIDLENFSITLNLPEADLSELVAEFVVFPGASVSIGGVPQVSGVTSNDFSQPLTYTVSSEDGQQSEEWTVTITNQLIVAGIFEQDYDALVALYNATDGANWTNTTGWLEEGVDAEDWYGVSVSQNRVTYLDLANNNLSGAIPSEIGNLSALQHLYLNNNQLTGSIPVEIGTMSALQTLQLSFNELSGAIPSETGSLGSLQDLNLSYNDLSGAIPVEVGSLNALQSLSLHGNQLSGNIPAEIGDLVVLQTLYLNNNQLTGTIPSEMWSLVTLQYLSLYDNQLTGIIPAEIENLSAMISLLVSGNQLAGSLPEEIGSLTNLESLWLQDNQLSGTIPAEIGNLNSLTQLQLQRNNLTGSLPAEFGNLRNLSTLNLNNNPLAGLVPLSLTDLDDLATGYNSLSYSGTYLCEPQAQEWLDWKVGRNITGNDIVCTPTDLYVFRLEGIDANINATNSTISLHLPGADISALAAEFVVFPGASVSIEGVPQVSGVTSNDFSQPVIYTITSEDGQQSVDWLVDIDNQLIIAGIFQQDYDALVALYNATDGANWTNKIGWLEEGVDVANWYGVSVSQNRVTYVYSANNNLSGGIPDEIGNLTALQYLDFNNNQLTGAIPEEVGNMNTLISLLLGNNELSGTIPEEIGGLSDLQYLSLSGNQLTGAIPGEIGNLASLVHLDLAFNQLSGSIPIEIGNLRHLQLLTLSGNQLSGAIPVEIGNLVNLQNLWLANNQLTGNIPTEIGGLTSLTKLLLDGNNLTGSLPSELENLQSLGTLNLNNNPLTGPIPQSLISLAELATGTHSFSYTGTNLCERQNQEWLDWKAGKNISGNDNICDTDGLLTFSLPGQSSVTINETLDAISIAVEAGTDLSNLVASFTLGEGANAYVNDLLQVSGSTANDFRQPVTYTIVAEDVVTVQNWLVSVLTEQSITFGALPAKTFSEEPFALTATASSGLPVTYGSSNEAVATISGNMVTMKGVGETTITATQGGNNLYLAAAPVSQLLAVKVIQSITFDALPEITFGEGSLPLTATASSGLGVTYTSSDESVATVNSSQVTIIGVGQTTITASQAGDENYFAATPVTQLLTVNKGSQTIIFGALPAKTFGEEAFTLTATASSGLAVTYISSNEQVATIIGNMLTVVGAGQTTITAFQEGNENYLPAPSVDQLFEVKEENVDNRKNQLITFQLPTSLYIDEGPISLSAESDSALPVTYEIKAGGASIVNNILTFNDPGEITIAASQSGNDEFKPASVSASMTIIPLMSILGRVLTSNGSPISGVAQAIQSNAESGVKSQASIIDGTFVLTGLKDGDYLVKYIPNGSSASEHFPTYYPSSFFWQQAQSVTLSNADVKDIELSAVLKNVEPPQQGNGIIKGKVVAADDAGRARIVVGRIYEGGSPLENIPIYLMKSGEQNIFAEALTDVDGVFEMTGLPGGQYELFLDVPGIAMAPGTPTINLDESKPIELTAFVGEEGIVTEVSIVSSVETDEKLQFKVYPNPVSDYLVFDYEETFLENKNMTIRLYNILGQQLVARKIVAGKTLLDLRGYSPGMLMLAIFDESENLVGQLKIKKE